MAVIHTEIRENIPERIENDDIVRLFTRWRLARGDQTLPDISAFSIDDLDWCAGNLMLLKALEDDDFEYRYYGRTISAASGFDMTGKLVSSFNNEIGAFFLEKYLDCLRDQVPIYTTHRAETVTSVRTWERLMLPLTDVSGDRFLLVYNRPLEFKHELLEKILNTSRDGILVLEPVYGEEHEIVDFAVHLANREMQEFLKKSERQMLDRTISDLFPDQLVKPLDQICRTVFTSRRSDVFDVSFGAGEDKVLYQISASCIGLGLAITLSDQTALRRQEAQLVRLATTDPLTGAMNRRAFFELAEIEWRQAQSGDTALSLLLLDIDRFKTINDTHGHSIGDEVLVSFVEICMGTLRDTDRFARLGGEEFAILLPGTSLSKAGELAERILHLVGTNPVDTSAGPLPVTTSIGVALVSGDPANAIDQTVARADKALYRAKQDGRNRAVMADPLLPTGTESRIARAG